MKMMKGKKRNNNYLNFYKKILQKQSLLNFNEIVHKIA